MILKFQKSFTLIVIWVKSICIRLLRFLNSSAKSNRTFYLPGRKYITTTFKLNSLLSQLSLHPPTTIRLHAVPKFVFGKQKLGYTTNQRMTIRRLTKWRPDLDMLMIQRLLFFKKRPKIFSYPSRVSLKDFSYPLRVLERTHTTPHWVFLPLTGADF